MNRMAAAAQARRPAPTAAAERQCGRRGYRYIVMWNQMFAMASQMAYGQTEMLEIKKATQPVTRPPTEAALTRARLRHEALYSSAPSRSLSGSSSPH